mgnify:CR=1 FL=1
MSLSTLHRIRQDLGFTERITVTKKPNNRVGDVLMSISIETSLNYNSFFCNYLEVTKHEKLYNNNSRF